jgi:hypothetical protein
MHTSTGPGLNLVDELQVHVGQLRLHLEPQVLSALAATLGPVRKRLETMGALAKPAVQRALPELAVREEAPLHVNTSNVHVSGLRVATRLDLRRSGMLVRALARLLLGTAACEESDWRVLEFELPPLAFGAGRGAIDTDDTDDMRNALLLTSQALHRAIKWHYFRNAAYTLLDHFYHAFARSRRLQVVWLMCGVLVAVAISAITCWWSDEQVTPLYRLVEVITASLGGLYVPFEFRSPTQSGPLTPQSAPTLGVLKEGGDVLHSHGRHRHALHVAWQMAKRAFRDIK